MRNETVTKAAITNKQPNIMNVPLQLNSCNNKYSKMTESRQTNPKSQLTPEKMSALESVKVATPLIGRFGD